VWVRPWYICEYLVSVATTIEVKWDTDTCQHSTKCASCIVLQGARLDLAGLLLGLLACDIKFPACLVGNAIGLCLHIVECTPSCKRSIFHRRARGGAHSTYRMLGGESVDPVGDHGVLRVVGISGVGLDIR
jgi:hypothetical protein